MVALVSAIHVLPDLLINQIAAGEGEGVLLRKHRFRHARTPGQGWPGRSTSRPGMRFE
jgi:hypothetical protein